MLGEDRRTAYWLMLANVLLVASVLAEPILFGKVIDALTRINNVADHGAHNM